MDKDFDLIDRLQARMALLAIGRSSLRNQGAPGVVAAARKYLRDMDLADFAVQDRSAFSTMLDKHTDSLMRQFPQGAKDNWGAARKAMNLFLRDVCYTRPICDYYGLARLEPWLELPLDSYVYDGLAEDWAEGSSIPDWPRIRRLDQKVSAQLQVGAETIARRLNTCRVHLDLKYWRKAAIDGLDG